MSNTNKNGTLLYDQKNNISFFDLILVYLKHELSTSTGLIHSLNDSNARVTL